MRALTIQLLKLIYLCVTPFCGHMTCRFAPTCSAYFYEAVARHGVIRGFMLGIGRILRCHPWYKGEFNDPVPERFAWRAMLGYKSGRTDKNTS